jgi:hypothetical protein
MGHHRRHSRDSLHDLQSKTQEDGGSLDFVFDEQCGRFLSVGWNALGKSCGVGKASARTPFIVHLCSAWQRRT